MDSNANGASRLSAAKFWSNFVQPRVSHTQGMSRRSRPEELAQACQMIDEELVAMHLALCSLRTHRNTLVLISGLPIEVLSQILQLHAADQPPSKRDLGWIRVTHVCRVWRDAALHHPALWGNVTTELGTHWLELMLDRAKYGPLSYHQVKCGKDSKDFLSHILPNLLPRIRSLSIDDTRDAVDIVTQLLTSSAPTLCALELSALPSRYHSTVLPEGIFNNDSPMLSRLHLKGVRVSWSAPILRGLAYLHIEEDGVFNHRRGLASSFFEALNGLPALETLYLANTLPNKATDSDNNLVELLRLQTLTLIDRGPSCLYAIGRLEVPASCRLDLRCEYHNESELEECLPLMCRHCPARTDSFHTLFIADIDERMVGLKLWRKSNIHDPSILHPPLAPDLSISGFCRNNPNYTAVPSEIMCDTLPLDDIYTIIVEYRQVPMNAEEWNRLFMKNCRKVNTVSVNGDPKATGLSKALAMRHTNRRRTASTLDRLFLPDLKFILLQSVDLRYRTGRDGKNIIDMAGALVEMLDMRRAKGRAISVIRFGKECVINTAQLNALRSVAHVELDAEYILEVPGAIATGSS